MKQISRKKLTEAIQAAVLKKLLESNSFSALRTIQHLATSTSMEFEKTLVDTLGLMDPDHMQPDLQGKYFEVVSRMKEGLVASVMTAAKELLSFPKAQDQMEKK